MNIYNLLSLDKINENSNVQSNIVTLPNDYTSIIDANNDCNNIDDKNYDNILSSSNNDKSYGMKQIIKSATYNTDNKFRVVCQKNYPKTYISSDINISKPSDLG